MSKTPRMLVVTTVAGTVLAFLVPHIKRLQAQGVEVEVASNAGNRTVTQAIEEQGIAVHHVPFRRRLLATGNLSGLGRLVRLIREGEYKAVHVHTPVAGFLGRLAARLADPRARTVYTAHGFHFHQGQSRLRNAPFVLLEKLAGRWTDYLVVINREDEEAARRYRIVPEGRVYHVPGVGLDLEAWSPEAVSAEEVDRIRKELELDADAALFVMVAEFNPGKRHRDALRALAGLGRPDVHLALAGKGRLMGEMQALARKLRVADRVHFLGARRDVPALMRAASAVVLPSEREGLSRSALEALALEVPLIGSNARGVRDLVEGGAGLTVEVGDVEALARAMAWVLDHPEEVCAMAARGRRRAKAYALPRVLEALDRIYGTVLGAQNTPTATG